MAGCDWMKEEKREPACDSEGISKEIVFATELLAKLQFYTK